MNARTCSAHGAKAIGDRAGIQSPAPKPFFFAGKSLQTRAKLFRPFMLSRGGERGGGSWDFLYWKKVLLRGKTREARRGGGGLCVNEFKCDVRPSPRPWLSIPPPPQLNPTHFYSCLSFSRQILILGPSTARERVSGVKRKEEREEGGSFLAGRGGGGKGGREG